LSTIISLSISDFFALDGSSFAFVYALDEKDFKLPYRELTFQDGTANVLASQLQYLSPNAFYP
jgi:hypothetical protein